VLSTGGVAKMGCEKLHGRLKRRLLKPGASYDADTIVHREIEEVGPCY